MLYGANPMNKISDAELDVMLVIWGSQEMLDTGEISRRLRKDWKIQALQVVL